MLPTQTNDSCSCMPLRLVSKRQSTTMLQTNCRPSTTRATVRMRPGAGLPGQRARTRAPTKGISSSKVSIECSSSVQPLQRGEQQHDGQQNRQDVSLQLAANRELQPFSARQGQPANAIDKAIH